jgi:hypothetical protein
MINHVAIDYQAIKKFLRRGDIQTLAEKFGISQSAAYKIMNGRTKNFDFIEAAYKKAIERASIIKAFNEKLHV